jgi:hypothetical protein
MPDDEPPTVVVTDGALFFSHADGEGMNDGDEVVGTKTPEGRTQVIGYREAPPRRVERSPRMGSQVEVVGSVAVAQQSQPASS